MFPNSTILGPFFWIIMGVLYTLFIAGLFLFFRDNNFKMSVLKWILLITWYTGLNIVIAGAFTLIGENESGAGLKFLGIFGTVFIVLGAGLWQFIKKD